MTARPAHFTPIDDDRVQPTRLAQSLWGEDHLNGPAVVGLAAHALETAFGLPDFLPARLTVDLFRAARGVPTTTVVTLVRDGRRVRNSECDVVQDGVTVARATLVQYRLAEAPPGQEWFRTTDFTPPEVVDDGLAPYLNSGGEGWTRAILDHQNASRKRYVNRAIDVIEGQANSPFVRAAVTAEGTSLVTNMGTAGVGYINGDLTVALSRLPQDDWVGVEADSHWAARGIAVGTTTLYDSAGPFGTGLTTAVSNPGAQIDFAHSRFPDRIRRDASSAF
ncbi:thioesterase [Mycobacterium sp. ST-F2]|uniref:acyl-CoA thioesterase domain-containing protein n=1 Tax=Mycobacterium sp. ST-F2 TaxID=1490484 RepID=UPI00093A0D47|nr:acyl-CoA thioesterase domain-containing protein [Mycobacterium sp. ST-F2]OKH81495.1 thioesterase [Mycobacterium sp. ST-F2]